MNRLIIISFMAGVALLACETEQENPVLNLSALQPAQITAPQAGGEYVLAPGDDDDEVVFTARWTAAGYPLQGMPAPRYAIEIDEAGNNFANPATIATVENLEFEVQTERLNDALGILGLEPDVAADVDMRIRSFIPGAVASLFTYSEPVTFAATPFVFVVPPIYILGSGTPAGWSNTAALPMEHVEGGTYTIVTTLTAGANQFLKFISVLGQWAPQWGTDQNPPTVANGVISGNLVYRPTESVPDPPAIPVPATTGQYRITADTIALRYTIEPVSSKMYVIGDAAALEMKRTAPGKYHIVLELDGSEGKSIQLSDSNNGNGTRFGSSSPVVTAGGKLVEINNGKIMLPAQKGKFRIEYNQGAQTYRIVRQ
jgi:hypothetical protein